MREIYSTKITNIGDMAEAFYGEKMVILFKDNAPEELADYCILHQGNQVSDVIQAGDVLAFNQKTYNIVCVGEEVQPNLTNLGHITLRFDGSREGLGGSLYLEDTDMPSINIGDQISIYRL